MVVIVRVIVAITALGPTIDTKTSKGAKGKELRNKGCYNSNSFIKTLSNIIIIQ